MSGAPDSVAAVPGSPDALFRYRFKQTDPPGSGESFTYRDRDLSFHFKPSPLVLHFQIENLQDQPVWIEWDRCTFYPPVGFPGKVAHKTTVWGDRLAVQPPTRIVGLGNGRDYLLPIDYLVDPAGTNEQLHWPLLPEDDTSAQYTNNGFGADLVFRIDERYRTYSFRFRVASVAPR